MLDVFVTPTKAAGVLDLINTEGRTVLMYAAMHGLTTEQCRRDASA